MIKMKRNIIMLASLIFIGISLLGAGLAYAQGPNTTDQAFSFTFGGPLSMKYTDFRYKGNSSSMYINITSTSDKGRPDFKIKPQMNKNSFVSDAGNGGTVNVGKKYEAYNSVNESGSNLARFRGEGSTWGSLTFKGKWSPDYTKENGVTILK